jgi:hypothetical protein
MATLKTGLRWLWAKMKRIREWSSGDDLHEAQMNRGDDHDHRANPGGLI